MVYSSGRADYEQPKIVEQRVVPCLICQSPGGVGGHGETGQNDDPLDP